MENVATRRCDSRKQQQQQQQQGQQQQMVSGALSCKGRAVEATVLAICVALALLPIVGIGLFSRSALVWRMEQVLGAPNAGAFRIWGRPPRSAQFMDLAQASNLTLQELENLDSILESASFRNRTVILTTLNQAWATEGSMLDMFLDSFRKGVNISSFLDHLVIVALDQIAYNRCSKLHRHCFVLKTDGIDFSGEKFFMSEDYLKMMWRRVYFLGVVLRLGYNFVFSDADILWFRDPFKHFHPGADFEIACDQFYGSAVDLRNKPNGGFLHVRSNNRTVELYKFWYEARLLFPGKHDQDVLDAVKYSAEFWRIDLRMRFLTTRYFGGFCQVSRSLDEVVTMHANCCTGLQRKMNDLKLVVRDWARYVAMTPAQRRSRRVYWRAPRDCLNSF